MKIQFMHLTERDVKEEGISYLHCEKCLQEKPANKSPREWARLSVATTKQGFQVWCVRHDLNVDNIKVYGPEDRQAGVPLTNACKH
jgi:hypothetical protein